MQLGKEMLGRRHVLEGVEFAIHDVQVEGTFPVSKSLWLRKGNILTLDYCRMGMFLHVASAGVALIRLLGRSL